MPEYGRSPAATRRHDIEISHAHIMIDARGLRGESDQRKKQKPKEASFLSKIGERFEHRKPAS